MSSQEDINKYTSVNLDDYNNCLGVLEHEHTVDGLSAQIRMHYIKLDGNGRPMVKALAKMLYTYIIDYCIAARNRPELLTAQQSAKLIKQARDLFRHPDITDESPDKTGEAGELLLYFLIEAVLNAPQVVSKMELKTNHKDEVKGSDGIHARFNQDTGLVDFFFGESKIYKESSSAIADAIKSIDQFHDIEMYQHEFTMVTKHFKYADEKIRGAISDLIIHGEPGPDVCINHACLIGYDFKGFDSLTNKGAPDEVLKEFLDAFLKDGSRLTKLIQKRFNEFDNKHIKFDVFFLPFPSVVEFRNAFNAALD
ncbi:HamA C-terminal domain-containing protein [Dasania marina]|uniref:HamA C-terminal domain-containing protein n=1 Tax=Dasania marina TaxID=471499 RepID=UPI000373FE1C|nr:DUF1837 domain-containing protein [Dasania marina]